MAWAVRSKNFVHARWAEQHKKALLEMDLAAAAGALFKSNARYKDAELRRAASAWLANTFITPDIKKYEAEVANYTEVGLARLELLGVVPIVEQVKSGIMQAYYALQDVSAPSRVISY